MDSGHNGGLNPSLIECLIEFKTKPDSDPFLSGMSTLAGNVVMCPGKLGKLVAGQITAYATWVLSAQYRTHLFLVLIFKHYSRLIRWDRGGAVVTEPISHETDSHLLDFLIRFKDADRQARGHDTTVGTPTEDEELNARTFLELASDIRLLSASVSDPSQPQKIYRFIISAPCPRPDIPAGRWTRTSIAYDVQTGKRVLLKDSWRVLLNDIKPEGKVYEHLWRHEVPHIPFCSYSGDVGDQIYHASRTHEFGAPSAPSLVPHRHYRLVLDTIGRGLETFKRSLEVVTAIHDALVGKFTVFMHLAA
jgi:Fungal protein kinase